MRIDQPTGQLASLTGSYTGSFLGDGSNLTGVPAGFNVTNESDDRVLTSTGTATGNAEANLTFDGTELTLTGNATITGNLTVSGTQTQLNTTTLNIEDKNLLIASGAADSAAADGAGLTVDGADATFTYSHSGTQWNMNKKLDLGSNDFHAQDAEIDSLGIGTAASGTTGEIRATGDITAFYSSDERLKENFAPLTGALDKVKAIGGYEFDWKDGIEEVVSKTGHDIGVKAQELQAQYPELVHERDNGYLAVDYIKLNAVLIEAVKELAAKVDELSK